MAAPGRPVRRARLRHLSSPSGEALYAIVQTTELDCGRVGRQFNVLDPKSDSEIIGS
jgi:hypothetical protein